VLDSIQVKLSGLELRHPRGFGDCWLGCELWHQLGQAGWVLATTLAGSARTRELGESIAVEGGK
jgi:hypothetical protein